MPLEIVANAHAEVALRAGSVATSSCAVGVAVLVVHSVCEGALGQSVLAFQHEVGVLHAVAVLTSDVSRGTLVSDVSERTPAAVQQKLDWIRQGAGARFNQIELSLIPTVIVADDRRRATAAFIRQQGWAVTVEEVWQMPSVLIGSIAQITADIQARREAYGFSYYVVADHEMETFAPIVAHLHAA